MNDFSRPAAKGADERLFEKAAPSVKRLQKQSRAELRLKARREYWDKQHAKDSNG